MSNGLSGISSIAYQGTNAATPPNITTHHNRPTPNFYQNFQIGDFWVYIPLPPGNNNELWVLMGVAANIANWVLIGGGTGVLLGLTGNSGGEVFPLLGNINVVGDGTTINIVGDPATHTLTVTALDTGTVNTLTGNTGGAVGPSAGNINVVGDGTTITIVGDPATHTLTVSTAGDIATSYVTNSGTAVPAAGILDILGAGGITTTGSGNTVTITGSGGTVTEFTTSTDGHVVTPTAGNINLHAGAGISITGTVGPNTVTITNTAINPASLCSFSAYLSTSIANVTGDSTLYTIPFDEVFFDLGGNFNTGTGYFTAPIS